MIWNFQQQPFKKIMLIFLCKFILLLHRKKYFHYFVVFEDLNIEADAAKQFYCCSDGLYHILESVNRGFFLYKE